MEKIWLYQNIRDYVVLIFAEKFIRNFNTKLSERTRESRVRFQFEITIAVSSGVYFKKSKMENSIRRFNK